MPRLLFFAAIREAAGARTLDVDATTVGEALKDALDQFANEVCLIEADRERDRSRQVGRARGGARP